MLDLHLEKFQGPLELLLQLIEQNQLSITDVALAQVTDQYIGAVKEMQSHSMTDLADFMLVASRLLLIKSKALLPSLELTLEEEEEVKALKHALEEYQRYKEKAKYVKERARMNIGIVTRELWQGRPSVFYPPEQLNVQDVEQLFQNALQAWEKFIQPKEEHVMERAISIEQKI